jgi:hypothetical protein
MTNQVTLALPEVSFRRGLSVAYSQEDSITLLAPEAQCRIFAAHSPSFCVAYSH